EARAQLCGRAGADARRDERARALGMAQAEMQGRERAHAQAHDMRALDLEVIEDGGDIVGLLLLAIDVGIVGYVRGRIAARVVGNAAIAPREEAQLRLPAAEIAREFMDEDQRITVARLLVIEPGTRGLCVWHVGLVVPSLPRE